MTDWTSLRYAVVDVEGNGRQPPDLVELAVVPITDGTIMQPKSWLVRPDTPINYVATRIHGITNQQLIDAPVFSDVEAEIRQALDNAALIAHNAHVDVRLLQRKLGDWECPEVFDTLKLARRLMPDQETHKLGALVTALSLDEGLPADLTPHRATYDTLVTARLFITLATLAGSLETLRNTSPEDGNDAPGLF